MTTSKHKTMRRLIIYFGIAFLFSSQAINAQDIFKKYGFDKEPLTLSNGRYNEFFSNDEIVQIGTVLLNTKNNQVVSFIEEDTTKNSYSAELSSRWLSIDPLAAKYPQVSPYVFVLNNPLIFIDPDGREVFISGALSNEALQQLQARVGSSITLAMDDNGKITYTSNTDKNLKGDAKRMANMVDNNSITVNLITTDKNETSTGNLMIGGAFMGNTVTTDADGNTKVVANQEVNPNVLGSADAHTNTPGKMMMHEATEAYAGAQISQKAGVGVGPATQADVANPSSVYNRAHNRATSQTPVYQTLYDRNGKVTTDVTQAVRAEWSVTKNGKSKVIQSYP